MIDLAALASFRAVAQLGSVVAAADALGFTPSAVSQQVKKLERQVGVELLERVGRGVVVTGAGRQLVEEGARLLGDLEALEAGLHAEAGRVTGRLRVAAFSTAMRGLVAPVVRALHDRHPSLHLQCVEHEPWETVDLVAAGRADVGITHSWGDLPLVIPERVVSHHVHDDLADVVVAHDHRLAGRTRVVPSDLVDEAWIATPEGTICREWLGRMFDGTGRRPRIAHVAADFDTHLALAAAGLGIALVPRLGRSDLGPHLRAVAVHRPRPTRQVGVLHRESMSRSPGVRALVDALAAA